MNRLATALAGAAFATASAASSHAAPDTTVSNTDATGTYRLRADSLEANPAAPYTAPEPQPWLRMHMTTQAQPEPNSEAILALWSRTGQPHYKNGHGAEPILYQEFTGPTHAATLMVGETPACVTTRPPVPGKIEAQVSNCPAFLVVTSRDKPTRMERFRACFTYNEQAAPGSATDPRRNANYTRFDPEHETITLYTVKNGTPIERCTRTLPLATPLNQPPIPTPPAGGTTE